MASVDTLYGQETNRLYRQTWGLTYNGIWDWGQSKAGVYYEKPTIPACRRAPPAALKG